MIVQPPKLFLDTNHLINIAKVRRGRPLPPGQSPDAYSFIDQCISRHYGVVFLQSAPLDWVDGNSTESSAREIAQVIDSARLKYLLEPDYIVYLSEVLSECQRQRSELNLPQLRVLHVVSDNGSYEPAHLKVMRLVPDYFPDRARESLMQLIEPGEESLCFGSVQDIVRMTISWRSRNQETYQRRVSGFSESLAEDICQRDQYFANRNRFHLAWLRGFLKVDRVIMACNDGITDEDVSGTLSELDLTRCPSVQLYLTAREQRIRLGHHPAENDVDDWANLPAVTYADVILTDRRFRDVVLRADRSLESRVFCRAEDAAASLEE